MEENRQEALRKLQRARMEQKRLEALQKLQARSRGSPLAELSGIQLQTPQQTPQQPQATAANLTYVPPVQSAHARRADGGPPASNPPSSAYLASLYNGYQPPAASAAAVGPPARRGRATPQANGQGVGSAALGPAPVTGIEQWLVRLPAPRAGPEQAPLSAATAAGARTESPSGMVSHGSTDTHESDDDVPEICEGLECKVCMERERDTLFVPCGHLVRPAASTWWHVACFISHIACSMLYLFYAACYPMLFCVLHVALRCARTSTSCAPRSHQPATKRTHIRATSCLRLAMGRAAMRPTRWRTLYRNTISQFHSPLPWLISATQHERVGVRRCAFVRARPLPRVRVCVCVCVWLMHACTSISPTRPSQRVHSVGSRGTCIAGT
jgi:hypothetical protein